MYSLYCIQENGITQRQLVMRSTRFQSVQCMGSNVTVLLKNNKAFDY